MKITEFQKVKFERRKALLEKDLPRLALAIEEAKAHGDLSENSEYDAAISEHQTAMLELSELIRVLESAEVVSYDSSSIITEGSFVKIQKPTEPGNVIVALVSDEGNIILDGVINTKSPLGMKILGNVDGIYSSNGTTYNVTKIRDYKSVVDSFVEKYESSDKVLADIFSGAMDEEV